MRLNISVVLLVTLLALTEDIVSAQPPKKIPRIGWIAMNGSKPPPDFMTGLHERGYVEGQSITVEFRSAQGSEDRLSEVAIELVRLNPDVIVAYGNGATEAAWKATTTIPIVFEHGDPIGDSVVGGLAQPGKNLTGLSVVSFELAAKRLELLCEAFPKTSRIAVILTPETPVHRRQFADMKKMEQTLGVQLQAQPLPESSRHLDSLFLRIISQRANALLMLQSPTFFRHRRAILDLSARNRLPAIYPNGAFAEAGGLMSYGADYRYVHRRMAYYVDRILKGGKPSDLPVEQPTNFELVINLKTAKQIGLAIPPKVLMWADRVIE